MKHYIRLARPHHWLKNGLVLVPLIFSGQLGEPTRLFPAMWGLLAFCLLASAIYVINDIRDAEKDRLNSQKCHRPIASGAISQTDATAFAIVLLAMTAIAAHFSATIAPVGVVWLGLYFLLNLAYSFGLKNVPLVDIAILVSGFLIRVLFGGAVTGIALSKWLCLTVTAASFYLGLGKRKGELTGQKSQRAVLKYYSYDFLDKNMYVCMALTVMFYTMWTVDALTVARVGNDSMIWTVPLVLLIFMKYNLDANSRHDGDPVEILLHDKSLILMATLLAAIVFYMIYT